MEFLDTTAFGVLLGSGITFVSAVLVPLLERRSRQRQWRAEQTKDAYVAVHHALIELRERTAMPLGGDPDYRPWGDTLLDKVARVEDQLRVVAERMSLILILGSTKATKDPVQKVAAEIKDKSDSLTLNRDRSHVGEAGDEDITEILSRINAATTSWQETLVKAAQTSFS